MGQRQGITSYAKGILGKSPHTRDQISMPLHVSDCCRRFRVEHIVERNFENALHHQIELM
jgi:hypothetical protein